MMVRAWYACVSRVWGHAPPEKFLKLAECVALWGEPEQSVHGMKETRAAVSSGMKEKRETI